ncbi:MAG: ABC transporter ATP-binding protein, partial [Saprospiraceae bacterium]|nr:ABC transporter ATP-binding protein [Saprospiraceae bacterium]
MSTALKMESVSKRYKLGQIGMTTLVEDTHRLWARMRGKGDPYRPVGLSGAERGKDGFVWALEDVSFEVPKGQILGIIGHNGAGKSTILKILSKVTGPTSGRIKIKGRIGSLLEVGTGMHGEMTGRENIYLNGAILGMTTAEIKQKFDDIVAFSGIGPYIDTPIKRYSSGMTVRLGFAVAAFLEPEILIVDEVLAVGDLAFQQKCLGKLDDVSKGGRTVLFVSHNLGSIEGLCERCLFMKEGKLEYDGSVGEAIRRYREQSLEVSASAALEHREDRKGKGFFKFSEVSFNGNNEVLAGRPLSIRVRYAAKKSLDKLRFSVYFMKDYRNLIMSVDSLSQGRHFSVHEGRGTLEVAMPDLRLMPGTYLIGLRAEHGTVVE